MIFTTVFSFFYLFTSFSFFFFLENIFIFTLMSTQFDYSISIILYADWGAPRKAIDSLWLFGSTSIK